MGCIFAAHANTCLDDSPYWAYNDATADAAATAAAAPPPCSAEIAAAVTAANPRPVTLKLEKVYQPCILQTKKRYVGFAYEAPEQESPVFDAKGIETVRCGSRRRKRGRALINIRIITDHAQAARQKILWNGDLRLERGQDSSNHQIYIL